MENIILCLNFQKPQKGESDDSKCLFLGSVPVRNQGLGSDGPGEVTADGLLFPEGPTLN